MEDINDIENLYTNTLDEIGTPNELFREQPGLIYKQKFIPIKKNFIKEAKYCVGSIDLQTPTRIQEQLIIINGYLNNLLENITFLNLQIKNTYQKLENIDTKINYAYGKIENTERKLAEFDEYIRKQI